MPLSPGTTLGPYAVIVKLGAGDMGEVYRACDTKLDRDVALKVLPEAFTADQDRLARFEREATVLASLNHPNVGHIYGLEEAERTKALILELIEGPTLADRIADGPISIDDTTLMSTFTRSLMSTAGSGRSPRRVDGFPCDRATDASCSSSPGTPSWRRRSRLARRSAGILQWCSSGDRTRCRASLSPESSMCRPTGDSS